MSVSKCLSYFDYYPYGVEFPDVAAVQAGVSGGVAGSEAVQAGLGVSVQPYRFNGKESQEFAGFPYLDYGARFYHPLSSRWTTMDPLSEKYYFISPYAFCSGNPVTFAIKREQNELAHFAEREQRKALRGLTLLIRMG